MKSTTKLFLAFSILFTLVIIGCSKNSFFSKANVNFTKTEVKRISNGDEHAAMRVWKIDEKSDSILLRMKSSDVIYNAEDAVLNLFIKRLHATVLDSINAGVGIAAPQVGILKNIIWVQRFDKLDYPFEVYINPKIIKYSDEKQPCQEGCLSIPERSDMLQVRSKEIEINYLNALGEEKTETVNGFTAVIFQHEIDHLSGILYTDYLN